MEDPQKDHLNLSLEKLTASKDGKLLYEQKIEMTEIKLNNNMFEKSSDVSEKSPFLKPDDYVKKKKCRRFFQCFWKREVEKERTIYLNGTVVPENKCKNAIANTKYNILTLIPIVLYNQFKFFFNLFYLIISLSQFIPVLKVGYLFTYIAPLAFVLVLTIIKEAYDDIKRYQKDREVNLHKYEILEKGEKKYVASKDLKVGDIVMINSHERVPADLLILAATEPNGSVFIKTDQLDGETDWKVRRAIRYTQHLTNIAELELRPLDAKIVANPPNDNIYDFCGYFEVHEVSDNKILKEPLNLEHTMWANTILTSGKIIGLVTYSGKETRSAMNSRKPRTKVGIFDQEINFLSKLDFIFMVLASLHLLFLNGIGSNWYVLITRYILLLSWIIPISMRVNLDFAKALFSYNINRDPEIPGSVARNSNIPEELGRVKYLLTDKTGTLTQNDMIFKKLVTEQSIYSEENILEIKRLIKKNCEKYDGPCATENDLIDKSLAHAKKAVNKKNRRENDFVVRDIITALAICNNVTPSIDEGVKVYQASSPDEVALVKFAETLSMTLIERNQEELTVESPTGSLEKYQVLAMFPFSSESKRMGILVRHLSTNRVIFYLKGADSIIQNKVKKVYKPVVQDECENLAREGLRTLVIAQKILTEEEYDEWNIGFEKATVALVQRHELIRECAERLEVEMDFLGVTGVEDKLQENVCASIEALRHAGIKVWMLTGDKVETAKCIAISAGIKASDQDIFEIKGITDSLELHQKIIEYSNKLNNVLLIEGTCLGTILQDYEKLFFDIAAKAPAVIFCRCLPTQKAIITEGLKKFSKQIVCCVGDGGNDVGMIQSSDVGLGIVGKEGLQAALASDFSVQQFRYINDLLLWHGRLAYKRSSTLAQFVLHRGLIIAMIQFIFCSVFYFVAIAVFNGFLMFGYSTFYTSLPVFCLILDEDISRKKAMEFPPLYKTLQKGRELNGKSFLCWVWISMYQGAVIMLLGVLLFKNSFVEIITITFTALILSELLNVHTTLISYNRIMIFAQLLTLFIYFMSIIFLRNYIDTSIINGEFVWKVLVIVFISWFPIFAFKKIKKKCDPSDEEKLMMKV